MNKNLKDLLDFYTDLKNNEKGLNEAPDPFQVSKTLDSEVAILACALFAYGSAKNIVKFLHSLDFSLLEKSDDEIKNTLKSHKYRFQNSSDVAQIFITLKRFSEKHSIENLVAQGIKEHSILKNTKEINIVDGINLLISKFYELNDYRSDGYEFFFGRCFDKTPTSPYKRYNMFLRWMVRDGGIDLGRYKNIDKKDLLMPLDVHTHRVSLALGLCKRKSYDYKTVVEITKTLREFDPNDPIKYDFALYRIGQLKELELIKQRIKSGI
ncbi:MAG: TIGR02757 family protein [Campylobacter sp.]|nr:TIGR02757 family protein [Campylobacter sp.]